jgi:hypothetical protein
MSLSVGDTFPTVTQGSRTQRAEGPEIKFNDTNTDGDSRAEH